MFILHKQKNIFIICILFIELSDISIKEYLAAWYAACTLLIFGLTPTWEPPI